MTTLLVPPLDLNFPTLGPGVKQYIEENCVFGPGSRQGEPAELDPEKTGLLYRMYEIMPREHKFGGQRRFHRCGFEVRKGLAKTEFGAWIAKAELSPEAPVRFDGWDANGNPVGRPVNSPYIPMMAVTEEQAEELAFGVLKYICEHSPDVNLYDIGKERIIRMNRWGQADGMAVPVSNAPGARDGALTTFQHFDEPHRLFLKRQVDAHETMSANLSKRQIEDPWSLYTSTAGQPGQGSVMENIRKEAEQIESGRRDGTSARLFFFARWAGPEHDDLSTVEKRVAAVAEATGPVGEWGAGQFERIAEDYDREGMDRAYWERVYLNRWHKGSSQAFDMRRISPTLLRDTKIPKDAFCTLGFDGARFRDATGFVITDIETGMQQCEAFWEKPIDWPTGPGSVPWEIPEIEVHDKLEELMHDYEIHWGYYDPPYWTETVASWAAKYPDRVIEWWTNRPRPMSNALRTYIEAIEGKLITYGDNMNRPAFLRHLGNSGKKELKILDDDDKPLYVLQKMDGRVEDKIDIAMCGILSWQACIDARRDGAKRKPKVGMPRRLY